MMNDDSEIKNKIWNIEKVVDDIRDAPQTYDTILKFCRTDGTCQIILRRKLNALIKSGNICKTNIPGTRFGKLIFYILPKKYFILIEAGRAGSKAYFFYDFKRKGKYYIQVEKAWMLREHDWIPKNDMVFFEGDVLKFI